MTNHPFLPVGNRAGHVRRPQTLSLLPERSSFAARAAVHRTCNAVTLRCRRVLARYRPAKDEFEHVAVGDPDPGPTPHHQVCRFEWEDEVSPCLFSCGAAHANKDITANTLPAPGSGSPR